MGKKTDQCIEEMEDTIYDGECETKLQECNEKITKLHLNDTLRWIEGGGKLAESIFNTALIKTGIYRFKNRFSKFQNSFDNILITSEESLKITDTIIKSIHEMEKAQKDTTDEIEQGELILNKTNSEYITNLVPGNG